LNETRTLIVGQGLAGSLLAWELLRRGQRVVILDDDHARASSTAAAGLINPVTGMRLVRHPLAETFLTAAEGCYRALERDLHIPLLHWVPLWRCSRSETDPARHRTRRRDPAYKDFLGPWRAAAPHPAIVAGQGGFMQRHTGYLAPRRLLAALKDRFRQQGLLRIARVEAGTLQYSRRRVLLAGCRADRVVFCEGASGAGNPWFRWLPFQPVKGEILTLRADASLPNVIVNAGQWVLPLGNGRFKLGATYDRTHLDCIPTAAGRDQLLAALTHLIRLESPPRLLAHRAGIRPSTLDKAPFIGPHPVHPALLIFNGFGSRGSMSIPWYAARFADYLCGHGPVPAEADILRFRDRLK